MTGLERITFSDGFRVCLLETSQNTAQGDVMAVQVRLFDGGRRQETLRYIPQHAKSPLPAEAAAEMINRVVAPPHVLVVYGRGWLKLLHSLFAERLALFRILDLHATAIAMRPALKPRATTAQILQAYGVAYSASDTFLFSDEIELLLWAVVTEAGRRGLSWEDLLRVADQAHLRADFSRCSFDGASLACVPPRPGVYVMLDERARALYVGKSANLQRRLSEYFRNSLRLPDKIAEIRSRIRYLEYHLVGSELEALLMEHRLMAVLQPQLNVQRQVREGRMRYGAPVLPIMIVTPATAPQCVNMFLLSGGHPLYQFTFKPARHAARSLLKLLRHIIHGSLAPCPNRSLRIWGTESAEIAIRYFYANRPRLNWCRLDADLLKTNWWNTLRNMAKATLLEPGDASEYRDLDSDQAGFDAQSEQ